jgi:hypothetical protein
VDAFEGGEDLGAEEAVGVGHDADAHGFRIAGQRVSRSASRLPLRGIGLLARVMLKRSSYYPVLGTVKQRARDGWGTGAGCGNQRTEGMFIESPVPKSEGPGAPNLLLEDVRARSFAGAPGC